MKIYPTNHPTIKFFCHIDAYRLKTAYDLSAIGAMEYFGRADTLTVIEWADKIKKLLPKNTKIIKFTQAETNQREITYDF
jgi:tRNA A37 threonylcarbamoyladenosine biosynthesis protein TsaE